MHFKLKRKVFTDPKQKHFMQNRNKKKCIQTNEKTKEREIYPAASKFMVAPIKDFRLRFITLVSIMQQHTIDGL